MIFDYEGVKRALNHDTFSSRVSRASVVRFLYDAPEHTKLRSLISLAFTPRMVASPRAENSGAFAGASESIDGSRRDRPGDRLLCAFAMKMIAGIIGIPLADWEQYRRWSDVILRLSHNAFRWRGGDRAFPGFRCANQEMGRLPCGHDSASPQRTSRMNLLTRLIEAKIDGQQLSQQEILGFFQLLVCRRPGTTANLINNAMLCFLEHPDQLARLRAEPQLLPSAIEEVLR